jgi:cyclase
MQPTCLDPPRLSRRRALALAGAAGASLGFAPAARAQASAQAGQIPHWNTEFKQLARNVWAFVREGGPGIDNASLSNAGLIIGPDNCMLVDTLGPPIHAKEFRAAVLRTTSKPVTRIVHTHHHRDHTNGDYVWPGAEVVTTAVDRQLILQQGIPAHPYDTRPQWQEGMSELKLVPPTTAITGPVTYYYGDLEVRLLTPAEAHSFGDIMVHLPQHRLLFAGDIAFFWVMPATFNARVSSWLNVCDEIQKMEVDVIVPGHGPVGGKRELADMAECLRLFQREIRKGYEAGKSPAEAAADADLGRYAAWGNLERVPAAAVRLYAEWNGALTAANDAAGQAAAQRDYAAIMARRGR